VCTHLDYANPILPIDVYFDRTSTVSNSKLW